MKVNYKEIIEEMNEEIQAGVITVEDTIQVVRLDKPIMAEYRPVVDWYYDDYTMQEELNTPIEEMFMEEEFTPEEWKEMKTERAELELQYKNDQPKLETVRVKDILTEMKQMQKLLG